VTIDTRCITVPGQRAPVVRLLECSGGSTDDRDLRAAARSMATSATHMFVSRSYSFPMALVAMHDAQVGVDIELVTRWEPEQIESILSASERQRHVEADDRWATSLWSSKEALAMALNEPVSYDPRRLESPLLWLDGSAGRWCAQRLTVANQYEAWLCWAMELHSDQQGQSSQWPHHTGSVALRQLPRSTRHPMRSDQWAACKGERRPTSPSGPKSPPNMLNHVR